MKIAIIGYGVEGRAAYDYWLEGNDITICDQNKQVDVPVGIKTQLGDNYLSNLEDFDVIVRSPFVRPDAIVAANSDEILAKVTSSTNEFMRVCPTKNIIGITGTKGKGTTSTLVAKMLEASGKRVHLGGNIGLAALDLLKNNIQPDDYVVLELSSFQLIDLQTSAHIAACLMVAPEHLDWHADKAEYFSAKSQLFKGQNSGDIAIYYSQNAVSTEIASSSPGVKIPYFAAPGAYIQDEAVMIDSQEICRTSELKLLGQHNYQNVCAAITICWQITTNISALANVACSFSGLEHRLELVREHNNVCYYDDSFGTTPETAIVAIEAFVAPKVLILGGSDKGADYTQLAETVANSDVRKVLLIGEQAGRIQTALEAVGFNNFADGGSSMTEIVELACSFSEPGDVVLLSTACASFDMFSNYKDRGNQFKAAVLALA